MNTIKICYWEENDDDFIRWTSNLLRLFLSDGSVRLVRQTENPDLMLASVWRPHPFPNGLPVVLVSNENWNLFKPHAPLSFYKAVIGLYPPTEPCTFIQFSYAAVHFDVPVENLYKMRTELLKQEKTHFCCFVSSNRRGDLAEKRVGLCKEINKWRHIDAGGRVLNNLGYLIPRGLDFLRWIAKYQFMICLENSNAPGYITEKPFQAWFAGTVPIYDGGYVNRLNQDAIVNASTDDVLLKLKSLEVSPDTYEAKRRAQLCDVPLSLAGFEQQFKELLLTIS